MALHSLARSAGTAAFETVFPPVCPACHIETGTARTLCPACWHEITFLDGPGCRHCGRIQAGADARDADLVCDDCLRHPPLWDRGRAVFRYEGTGRKLVLGLKHGDRLDTVPMLSGWMARAAGPLLARADLIVPVPLHWTRRLKRRTNQAAELARRLAAGSPARFAPLALRRTKRTVSQDGKSREARTLNLEGALQARPEVARRSVLLIDDVLTTGATLNAATKALLDARATRVDILVLALVVREDYAYLGADKKDEDTEHEDR